MAADPAGLTGPAAPAVRAAIAERGPLRFDEFMAICLYDPDVGFYAQPGRGAGRQGRDFLTSPEVGSVFAEVLGRAIDRWWTELGEPAPFVVADVGSGPGTLYDQLRSRDLACSSAAEFVMVDVASARSEARPELPSGPFDGVIVANELFDNLPFRIVESDGRAWREVRVGESGWEVGEPVAVSGGEVRPSGVRLPVHDAINSWVDDTLARLDRGVVVAFDYAATADEMAQRPWLRTYREHTQGADPLVALGDQDITADVRVDGVQRCSEMITQADFLRRHGIDDLAAAAAQVWRERAHLGDLTALQARSRAHEAETLTDPDGLGGFMTLIWTV